MEKVRSEAEVREAFINKNPLFTIVDDSMKENTKRERRHQQHVNMKYFIDVSKEHITTNSAVVMSMLLTEGAVQSIDRSNDAFPAGTVVKNMKAKAIEGAVNRDMLAQAKVDSIQMFVCAATGGAVEKEEVDEAKASADKRHEADGQFVQEYAWDDVNDCMLDVNKVKEARAAEMEYLRKMKVYRKVPIQRCKDLTGRMPIKVRWIDTNKQDERNPR